MTTLFEQSDYKDYLREWLESRGRGESTRVARALKVQLAYISQVTRGACHLSLEQSESFSRYAGHTSDEAEFFLLLVSKARAGTESLKQHYERKLAEISKRRKVLSERLVYQKKLSPETQAAFYSVWVHSAVHMALTVPGLETLSAIAAYLGESEAVVRKSLEFLVGAGLARPRTKGIYEATHQSTHAGNDSPFAALHHTHWRLRAVDSIPSETLSELHYSSVVSISRKDIDQARKILIRAIEDVRALVKPSPPEELVCYNLDLFSLRKKSAKRS